MTLAPVTLAEFRDTLNLDDSEAEYDNDGERWRAVLSATEIVEDKCGPIRPRITTSRVRPNGCTLYLPTSPVLSLTSVTDFESNALDVDALDLNVDEASIESHGSFTSRSYTVVYVTGRNPIPQTLMDAVLLVAKLQYESQRGPRHSDRMGGDETGGTSGLDWFRAKELMEPHLLVSV